MRPHRITFDSSGITIEDRDVRAPQHLSLADVASVRVRACVGPSTRSTITLAVVGRLFVSLEIEHLDRPGEVFDLACRIGAALGLTHYRVRGETGDIELVHAESASPYRAPGAHSLTRPSGPADYRRHPFEEPAVEPGAFVASLYQGPVVVAQFEPGQHVRLNDEKNKAKKVGTLEYVLAVCVNVVALGLIGFALGFVLAIPLAFFLDETSVFMGSVFAVTGLMLALGIWLVVAAPPSSRWQYRSLEIDWSTRRVRLIERSERVLAFEKIEAVASQAHGHTTDVVLLCEDADLLVLPEASSDAARRFGIALARALEVPYDERVPNRETDAALPVKRNTKPPLLESIAAVAGAAVLGAILAAPAMLFSAEDLVAWQVCLAGAAALVEIAALMIFALRVA